MHQTYAGGVTVTVASTTRDVLPRARAHCSGDEHELSLRRRALEHLVRAARFGERQSLGHDRVDLARTEQLGHPRRQNLDEHLARTGSGVLLLDHLHDLGPTEVIHDDALHRRPLPSAGKRPFGGYVHGAADVPAAT